MKRLVDEAHARGLAVVMDVVYNHLGPSGNYLREFGPYFTDRYATPWGDAINFDGPGSEGVRELVVANAGYWIDEFHLDGLRLDAVQAIADRSPEHVLAAVARRAREAAGGRGIVIVAESETQQAYLLRPADQGGCGLDGVWNDDFHHTARVALTGRREAYYSDYFGTPQELVSAAKHGYLYQGQLYPWQRQRRGEPALGFPPERFVACLENHDQVANTARGERLAAKADAGRLRALTALLLLGPWTPMLFQGQEWGSSRPFLYFADHHAELAALVAKGRREFLRQFPSLASVEAREAVADPGSRATFEASKLDWRERESARGRRMLALHRDLLELRRGDPAVRAQGAHGLDGAVLAEHAFVLRFFAADGADRLLAVNLGRDLELRAIPEPLVGPPAGKRWRTAWSSDETRYGGDGATEVEDEGFGWRLPAHCAALLAPAPRNEDARTDRLAPR